MAEVLLFHHAQGLTKGVIAFAHDVRHAGHTVHTPDLYHGRTFDDLGAGVAYAAEIGFGDIIDRGVRAADSLPSDLVYAGFSLGVLPAQKLAQTRAGARGALLFEACLPPTEFSSSWPVGVPVQIHAMDADSMFVDKGDLRGYPERSSRRPTTRSCSCTGASGICSPNPTRGVRRRRCGVAHRASPRVPRQGPGRQRELKGSCADQIPAKLAGDGAAGEVRPCRGRMGLMGTPTTLWRRLALGSTNRSCSRSASNFRRGFGTAARTLLRLPRGGSRARDPGAGTGLDLHHYRGLRSAGAGVTQPVDLRHGERAGAACGRGRWVRHGLRHGRRQKCCPRRPLVRHGRLDVIVHPTIEDPTRALSEVATWARACCCPSSTWPSATGRGGACATMARATVMPFGCGCHCNRRTLELIAQSPLRIEAAARTSWRGIHR